MRQTFDETTDPSFGAKHLPLLRAEMAKQGLDGLLVPHEDEHQNEYLPDANERLAWVSGFTGSAGAGVVLMDKAAVFVDGRYTVQAKAQTDPALFERVELNKLAAWLETLSAGSVIGYDPRLQLAQTLGQHLGGYGRDIGAKLAEPPRAFAQMPDHIRRPGSRDHRHAFGQVASFRRRRAAVLAHPEGHVESRRLPGRNSIMR